MKKFQHVLTAVLVFAAVFAAFPETAFARTYFPTHGRFAQPDPIIQNNLYRYVQNNPVNYTDPLGLAEESPQKPTKTKGRDDTDYTD